MAQCWVAEPKVSRLSRYSQGVEMRIKTGSAPTFELAKAPVRKGPWLAFAASRTEADFQALRDHIEWTRRKYAALDNGERVPIRCAGLPDPKFGSCVHKLKPDHKPRPWHIVSRVVQR